VEGLGAGDRIDGAIEYSADLFDRATIQEMARQLVRLIEQVVGEDRRVMDLTLDDDALAVAAVAPVEIDLNF